MANFKSRNYHQSKFLDPGRHRGGEASYRTWEDDQSNLIAFKIAAKNGAGVTQLSRLFKIDTRTVYRTAKRFKIDIQKSKPGENKKTKAKDFLAWRNKNQA